MLFLLLCCVLGPAIRSFGLFSVASCLVGSFVHIDLFCLLLCWCRLLLSFPGAGDMCWLCGAVSSSICVFVWLCVERVYYIAGMYDLCV